MNAVTQEQTAQSAKRNRVSLSGEENRHTLAEELERYSQMEELARLFYAAKRREREARNSSQRAKQNNGVVGPI